MKQEYIVLLDDNGEVTAKDGDLGCFFRCLRCGQIVFAKEVYSTQNLVCPHCTSKLKVRFFKNGSIRVSIR